MTELKCTKTEHPGRHSWSWRPAPHSCHSVTVNTTLSTLLSSPAHSMRAYTEKHDANAILPFLILELKKKANDGWLLGYIPGHIVSDIFLFASKTSAVTTSPRKAILLSWLKTPLGNISRKSFKCFHFGTSNSQPLCYGKPFSPLLAIEALEELTKHYFATLLNLGI